MSNIRRRHRYLDTMMSCGESNGKKSSKKSRKITEDVMKEYLAKKAWTKAMKASKRLNSKAVSGYSNELFVWCKKPLEEFSVKAAKKRQRERMVEIEKVKKRKEERGVEKAQREEEFALLARERAHAEFHAWEKKEQEFQFHQSKLRSQIRLREGRIKPIDILTNVHIQIDEPYTVFKGLSVKEIEDVREDIEMHLKLDRVRHEYWEALLVVCDWELSESRKRDAPEFVVEDRGLHPSVEADVEDFLQGKNYGELVKFQNQIESEMSSGTAKVVEYWEAVLKRLQIFKAKACLKEINAQLLSEHVERLEKPSNDKNTDEEFEAEDEEVEDIHEEKGFQVQVFTGYEWSKYNRTHYDYDNPPPKIVKGYKFKMFYPNLVEKTKAPSYTIEKDGDSSETCIIRFHAGPPYEDLAFWIVNKEWEYSHKKGYKCTFEGGILQLYFNFKRYCYRR